MSEPKDKKMTRLDLALPALGLAQSREKAKKMIQSGNIYVNGRQVTRPSQATGPEDRIEVRGQVLPYVSRGGLKLEKALQVFGLELKGRICMDVGASTGGFTDCMLQNGAARVYALDVGRDQLSPSLRQDPRVVSMEETNMRYVTPDMIPEPVSFASVDVSFISLTMILGPLKACMAPGGQAVCLVKPQFEAGRGQVGKKGVVRSAKIHKTVIASVADYARSIGWKVEDLTWSPVRGPEGNIEYLLYFSLPADQPEDWLPDLHADRLSDQHTDQLSDQPEDRSSDLEARADYDQLSRGTGQADLYCQAKDQAGKVNEGEIRILVDQAHSSLGKDKA